MTDDSSTTAEEAALQALILDSDLERLEDLLAEFNLFDVLNIAGRELQHSAFIGWLLDPKGSHGLRDYFLRVFLSQAAAAAQQQDIVDIASPIDVDGWGLSDVEVVNERHFIDILALSEGDGFACLIENKIFAPEGEGQLRGYLRTVKETYPRLRPFPIFLTPGGIAPREEDDQARWVRFDYGRVADIIDRTLRTRGSTISESVRGFLDQYRHTLRRHVLNTNENINELAVRLYSKHRAAIDLIIIAKSTPQARGLDLIEAAMREHAPDLPEEEHDQWHRRYFAPGLDEIGDLTLQEDEKAKFGGLKSGRIPYIEFTYSDPGSMTLYLWIGPGPAETRERLFQIAQREGQPYLKAKATKPKKNWHPIYQRAILTEKDYAPLDSTKAKRTVERAIRRFYEEDYARLVNGIRREFDLPAVQEAS